MLLKKIFYSIPIQLYRNYNTKIKNKKTPGRAFFSIFVFVFILNFF